MNEKIIQYILNPSINLIKRVIILCVFITILLTIDGVFGFSDFYFKKSKAETINEVSKNLSLSNIDSTSKELIRSDLYKIIHTRSYKERFGLFLDSVLNNRTVFIINRIPSNKIATDTNSKSIINIFVSILYSILFVLTSNIFLSLMLIFRINKQAIRYVGLNQTILAVLVSLIGLFISSFICLILPPYYNFGNYLKLLFNLIYGVGLFSIVIFYDRFIYNKEYFKNQKSEINKSK